MTTSEHKISNIAEPLLGESMNPSTVVQQSSTLITPDARYGDMAESFVRSDSSDRRNDEHHKKTIPWVKIIVALALVSMVIFVIVDSLTNKYVTSGFQIFLDWISANTVAGIFAFMGVYFLATVAFIPGSILTLGSGFVFGNAVGLGAGVAIASATVFIGASLGAIVGFLLGRYLLRDWVGRRLVAKYPLVQALDAALEEKGLRIFLLLRLSPIVPFNALNYIGGVTAVHLKDYTLALMGILPGTVLYCFIGASAGSLAESGNAVEGPLAIILIVIGIVLGLLAVFAVSYYAKKEFNRIVHEQEQKKHEKQKPDEESQTKQQPIDSEPKKTESPGL